MKKHFWIPIAAIIVFAMAFAFQNCSGGGGGGGGSGTNPGGLSPGIAGLGVFMDAPVAGVYYTTSSGLSGTTNAFGQFQFNPGDTITFSALGVPLGSVTPTISSDGTATVTPINLVPGASDVTDPQVTAIAQFLNTLNVIATADGDGATGVFTMPDNTNLQAQLQALNSGAGQITEAQLQSILDNVFGGGQFTVTPASTAQNDLQQGINSQNVVGTVWRGECTCDGGAYLYFKPNGALTGVTSDGGIITGSWSVAGDGHIDLSGTSASGGSLSGGTIPAGSSQGTGNVYNENDELEGVLNMTKMTSSTTVTNSSYFGLWYANYNVNSYGLSKGEEGGGCAIIMAGPGGFFGITDEREEIQGSLNGDGVGTATISGNDSTHVLHVDLAVPTGYVTRDGGVTSGSLSFARSGSCTIKQHEDDNSSGGTTSGGSNSGGSTSGGSTSGGSNSGGSTSGGSTTTSGNSTTSGTTSGGSTDGSTTSGGSTGGTSTGSSSAGTTTGGTGGFLVHVIMNWANGPYDPNSMTVSLTIRDQNGNSVGYYNKSESSNSNLYDGNTIQTTDDIVANYPIGVGVSYTVVTSPNCHVTSGGSGSFTGDASASYPATIDCP